MASPSNSVESHASSAGERVIHTDAFAVLARAGFVARGVIYAIIGVLAVKLALGVGGKATNQQGALRTIAHQPFGKLLLVLVAVGLAGYAVWRFTRAALGRGPEGNDTGFDRLAALGSGLAYSAVCALAVEMLLGSGSGSASNTHKTAAGVLGWPAGPWLVGIAGVAMIGIGGYQGYRALTKDFLEDTKTEEMGPGARKWVSWIGSFGYAARMVVFGLIGIFLIKAALDFNPAKAVGVDGALAKLSNSSHGSWLLGIVAFGLVAFALYSFTDARYRRI
jgi:hypothetical protein